jgi:biotin transport system substrate-specific component
VATAQAGPLALSLRPHSSRRAAVMDAVLVLGAAALTALAAQVVITLPFTPVPITGQTFAVLATASLLGRLRAVVAQLLYLGAGAAGLHVFAGGSYGLAAITGATGGYLVGFVAAAAVVGGLAERGWERRPWSALGTMLLGNLVIYAVALPWLYAAVGADLCSHPSFSAYIPQTVCGNGLLLTLYAGFFPFVVGDALKLVLAAGIPVTAWEAARAARGR